jgi:hypothetical protein
VKSNGCFYQARNRREQKIVVTIQNHYLASSKEWFLMAVKSLAVILASSKERFLMAVKSLSVILLLPVPWCRLLQSSRIPRVLEAMQICTALLTLVNAQNNSDCRGQN